MANVSFEIEMRMKSSITDWIQAIAVVIGIAFAIWEFVLHDREKERDQRRAVFELVKIYQSESIQSSLKEFFSRSKDFRDDVVKEGEPLQFHVTTLPIVSYYDSWAFCYEHDLCDRELAKEIVCPDFLEVDSMMRVMLKKLGKPFEFTDPHYVNFHHVCTEQTKKS